MNEREQFEAEFGGALDMGRSPWNADAYGAYSTDVAWAAWQARAALAASPVPAGWLPIESAPKQDDHSFLVRRDVGRGMTFVMQVSRFEGQMYPDHLESAVDYDDRITDATHWMPLPDAPSAPAQQNQCDGCMAGMPLERGIHRDKDGRPVQTCERDRYETAPAQPATEQQAATIDTLSLYKELCDLWREAVAVDTVIGRPDVLRQRIAALRDAVGVLRHDRLATPPQEPQAAAQAPKVCTQLSMAVVDAIANDGCRNAAGGIYETRVQEFAMEVQRAFAEQNRLQVHGLTAATAPSVEAQAAHSVNDVMNLVDAYLTSRSLASHALDAFISGDAASDYLKAGDAASEDRRQLHEAVSTMVGLAGVKSSAARDVLAERRRQVEEEGWTPEHDDEHEDGDIASAASAYALAAADALNPFSQGDGDYKTTPPGMWPWDRRWWKPGVPRRMLIKAGALVLAEIERLDRRAALKESKR